MFCVLSSVLLSRSRPVPSDSSEVMLSEVLSSLVPNCVLSKSCLCPNQIMETCLSLLCVLSLLQLCCHNIHQIVGVHQHKLSVNSKWSDSVSGFLIMYHPMWIEDQERFLYQLGQSSNRVLWERSVFSSLVSSQRDMHLVSLWRTLNQSYCKIQDLDPTCK